MKLSDLKQKLFRRDVIPRTPEMKGLSMVMGGAFLLAARLMVAPGIGNLFLLLAAVFLAWGLARWGKGTRHFPLGVLAPLVLIPCGVIEITGFALPGGLFQLAEGAAYLAGTAASVAWALVVFDYCAGLVSGRSDKTLQILRQRRWWVGAGYIACGAWAMVDGFTGWMPNVGVVMRAAAIVVDVFFLSALFQVRRAVLDAGKEAAKPAGPALPPKV